MGKHVIPDVQALFSRSGLSAVAMEYLASRFRLFQLDQGVKVIEKGKRGQFLAVVAQGQVEVEDEKGITRTLKRGEAFGEEMLHLGAPSLITATTRTRTQLWVLTRKDYLAAGQIEEVPVAARPKAPHRRSLLPFLILVTAIIAGLLFLYPELPNAIHFYVTSTLLEAGRPDLAERYLVAASNIQPSTAPVYDELGYVRYLQEKYPQALEAFETAVRLDSESASAQNNLGVLLMNMSQPEKAIDHFVLARDLDPGNTEIYYNLGNAYLSAGERESALSAYRRAVDLDPSQVDARNQIAGILTETGHLDEARKLLQEILVLQPQNQSALRGLGIIAVAEGKFTDAYDYLQKVTLADPGDAKGHFYLGLACEGLKMPEEAIKRFEIVQMLTEDPVLLEQAKTHLEKIRQ